MFDLRIPKDRVGVLIGKRGEIKKLIERSTNIKLFVDKEGGVKIEGEGIGVYDANLIIKAIGRGFNPEIALTLLKDENSIEIINIKDFTGKSKKKFERIKARIIGREGKARASVERLTETDIVVYGKTVAIIGKIEYVDIAKRGMEILLRGAPHGNSYKYMERELGKLKDEPFPESLLKKSKEK